MDSATKKKLISRIEVLKSKADLLTLMENASNLYDKIGEDAEIQKVVKETLAKFGAAAAAARAAKAKSGTPAKKL